MRLIAHRAVLLLLAAAASLGWARTTLAADPTPIDFSTRMTGDWGGYRQQLAEKDGIDFQLSVIADGTKNLMGGIDTASTASRTLVDVRVTLDLKPLIGLTGATAYADFQTTQGPSADNLIGDLQGIDSLDAPPGNAHPNRTQLAQLYYEQSFDDDVLRLRFGKSDVNADFDHVNAAQEFAHQSYGSSATLFTLPTYPDPSIGFTLFFQPTPDWQFQFGVFDGSLASGIPTGELGPAPYFDHPGDVFLIAELDKCWNTKATDNFPGRAGVGGWYNTNDFPRIDEPASSRSGTGGPYAFVEQTLWHAKPHALNAFLMYGYADPTLLPFTHNIGGGLTLTAPFPSRPNDIVGVGFQAIRFSEDYNATADYETDYELFYRLQLTPWFYLKPDLQYIANPGGQGTPDALAVTLRAQVDF